tara:strand:- start:1930 stop:2385 length:456 start_codon:yes stop_codon:yes gene_type:complete
MALTTGIINGSDLKVIIGADGGTLKVIENVTDCSISVTNEFRDATTKQNAGYRTQLPGMTSATMSFSALYASDSASGEGFNDLSTLQLAKTKCEARFTHVIGAGAGENAGDYHYIVKCYIESLELSGGTEDNATFTCNLNVIEEIVRSEIT